MTQINSDFRQVRRFVASLLLGTALFSAPALAQEGPDEPEQAGSGYSSLSVAQPKGTRELQSALMRLATDSSDLNALIDAGHAALLLNDPQAAIGFFVRADQIDPRNGRIKAGLGSTLLLNEDPHEALRLFDEAQRLGVAETVFASDRGLAYDLVGNFDAAQNDYELALRRGSDDETIRRYALSLGISGDRAAAEAQLDPLLRKRDAAAWRTRAFVLAVTGDVEGAVSIADATMPKRMAASIEPFFRFMVRLTPAQQAAAAHFGHFPQSAAIGKDDPRNRQYASRGTPRPRTNRADAGLIPVGDPLGPSADSRGRKTVKVDKAQRRRPGRKATGGETQVALAQPAPAAALKASAAPPLPAPPRLTGPVVATSAPTSTPTPTPTLPRAMAAATPATVQAIGVDRGAGAARRRAEEELAAIDPAKVQRIAGASQLPVPEGYRTVPAASSQGAMVQAVPGAEPASAARATVQAVPGAAMTSTDRATVQAVPGTTVPPATRATVQAIPPAVASAPGNDSVRPGFASLPDVTTRAVTRNEIARNEIAALPASPVQQAGTGAPAPQVNGPTGFDLARVASPTAAASASVTPVPSDAAPTGQQAATTQPLASRISLATIMPDIKAMPQEPVANPDAVDLTKIKPAPPKQPEAKKAEPKKPEPKKVVKPEPPKHPKRHWVQVAGGANRTDLAKEWKRLTGAAPQAFKGKQGWWTPLNATNRLLAGPFGSEGEAQAFVNALSKEKLSAFAFTSSEGQQVTKLGG
ncbi:SPOR domain-containing protein [Blastomonas sp.]|uniref:SPOR domain-containing protein n=1 Tax=Blastomonas sp. TaxID=1909299 RepID=UPI003593B305